LEIRVELARELKNSAVEREKIFKGQIKSQKINEAIKKKLLDEGILVTERNILKYKLYEEQKFMSPYTKDKIIPLSSLFDDRLYDIDHIIPKSRYFDDSFSNKVVCETSINEEKGNRTAWEYITQQNSLLGICSEADYVQHVGKVFYGRKKRNLLLEKIPTNPVERQKKDTQYISVAVKDELAKIVGSDNVKTSTGEVTSFLRSRWGLRELLMKLTQDRFKQMEWWDMNPETGAPHEEWVKMEFDKTKNKKVLRIKNWSKRYDHRHHAVDALTVALTEEGHIRRLNNLNKYLQDELTARQDKFKLEVKEGETLLEAFFNLEEAKRVKIQKDIESSRHFEMPFADLVEQAKTHLEAVTISIKVKDTLAISMDKPDKNTPYKQLKPQVKIRSALHKEMNYGKTKDPNTGLLRDTKTIDLSKLTAKDILQIVDEVLKAEINAHREKYDSMKEAFTGEGLKAFNQSRFQRKKPTELKPPVYKVKTWYSAKEDEESTLQRLYDDNEKLSVVTGENYLFLILEKEDKNGKERLFDLVSLFDAATIAKDALRQNQTNFKQKIIVTQLEKTHQELKVELINHQNDLEKKRATAKGLKKDTISEQIEKIDLNFKLKVLCTLQKNDLVYLPEGDEDPILNLNNHDFSEWIYHTENKKRLNSRVYKLVKFDKSKIAHFIPHNYANAITAPKDLTESQKEALKKQYADKKIPKSELNFVEYGSYRDCSPYESGEAFVKSVTETDKQKKKDQKLVKIQDKCMKLEVDWLGRITLANTL
ncbi:MAG: type II CRISPR RNA-guided endonuclease Cas9, partial [Flammeovirgaceae bacterium]